MSDQPEKKKTQKSNPLGGLSGSPLFTPSPPALPDLPTQQPATPTAQPIEQPPVTQPDEQQLLWCTPPSAEIILRDFVQRHDKQAIYVDIRYAGVLAALAKLVHKGNKTELINEMIEDILKKYSELLHNNEELVKILEAEIRKKHHIP